MPGVNIDRELMKKLEKVASKKGCSVEECVRLALREYIEGVEEFYHTDLNAVSAGERSFFLTVGK
jgi:metal-responsive CopG/Arc/MetJ family transcriptional regulator